LFVPNAAGRIYPSVNMSQAAAAARRPFNFQPVIHATDAEGVDRMLQEHGARSQSTSSRGRAEKNA